MVRRIRKMLRFQAKAGSMGVQLAALPFAVLSKILPL